MLEEIKAQNEAALAERDMGLETKDLEIEAANLKVTMKDLRRDDRIIEKEMVKQCQYLVLVEQKHKEVCEKYGVPSTLNPARFE